MAQKASENEMLSCHLVSFTLVAKLQHAGLWISLSSINLIAYVLPIPKKTMHYICLNQKVAHDRKV